MNNLLGSVINVLGDRLGQGGNGTPSDPAGVRFFTGYLVDESANNFVDESGNKFIYVERHPVKTPEFV